MSKGQNLIFELAEAPLSNALALNNFNQHKKPHPVPRSPDAIVPSLPHHLALAPHPHAKDLGRRGAAAQLNRQLKSLDAPVNHLEAWHDGDATEGSKALLAGLQSHIPRLAISVGNLLQPQGDTSNDDAADQRIINIVTSLPFLAVGAHMLRKHRTPEGREYATSMLAVGAAATLYHVSSGKFRRICRKLDYWTIAASSTSMVKAIYPQKPWLRRSLSASMLAIPFKPFLVSAAHTLTMQAEFARQAARHKELRPHFRNHAITAFAGGVAFAVEDALAERGFGFVHAAWHLLAAAGVASTGALVEHKERLRLDGAAPDGRRGNGGGEELGGIKGLRECHDSVVSLDRLGGGSPLGGSPRSSPSSFF